MALEQTPDVLYTIISTSLRQYSRKEERLQV